MFPFWPWWQSKNLQKNPQGIFVLYWKLNKYRPGKAFLQCEPTDVSLVWSSLQTPFHTPHKHELEGRACAGVFSWPSYLETFCCSPVKWTVTIDIAYCCCHIVLRNIGKSDHIVPFLVENWAIPTLWGQGTVLGTSSAGLRGLILESKTLTRLGCLKGNLG